MMESMSKLAKISENSKNREWRTITDAKSRARFFAHSAQAAETFAQ